MFAVDDSFTTDYYFYSELKQFTDISDFKKAIAKIIHRLGFSDYRFFSLDRSWKYEDDQQVFSTYPEKYKKAYKEEGLHLYDMVLSYAAINTRPIFTSQIYDFYCNVPFDTELSYKNIEIRQLDRSFGFFDCYVIPIIDGNSKMLFTLSKKNMDVVEFQKKVASINTTLRLLSQTIYTINNDNFHAQIKLPPDQQIAITPRQLQTLATFANGDLSINQVADKLFVSVVTAQQHIAAARKALNVKNNQAAIKRCIQSGLISYD